MYKSGMNFNKEKYATKIIARQAELKSLEQVRELTNEEKKTLKVFKDWRCIQA